jgi:hypothetical protein
MRMWWDFVQANLEAQRVVSLRLWKIAQGGTGAARESRRMIMEKFDASTEAAITLATGGTPTQVMNRYRRIMRANEKRLRRRRR